MFAHATSLTVNPMFLRHDLLIELGRLDIAIGAIRNNVAANDLPHPDHPDLKMLESAQSTIRQTLGRIPD
jgi:hypothetical protein